MSDVDQIEELGGNSEQALAGFVQRIETLEAEKKIAGEKIRAEYAAAAASGLDKKAIRALVKDHHADPEKTIALRAIIAAYRRALARCTSLIGTELGDWARIWVGREAKMRISEAATEAQEGGELLKDVLASRKKPADGNANGDGHAN